MESAAGQLRTPQTVLSFEFRADRIGDLHGIGVDDDLQLSSNRWFNLLGTQPFFGNRDFDDAYQLGDDWHAYEIPLGEYFDGLARYLTLGNDHDVDTPTANSWFRNMRLYERSESLVDIVSYSQGVQDVAGTAEVVDDQLTLTGNTWKALPLDYKVTTDTVLEFDFESLQPGELQGVGISQGVEFTYDLPFFVLTGTQSFFGNRDYYEASPPSGTIRIEIGDYYEGDISHVLFGNDHDVENATASAKFSNVRLFESTTSILPASRTESWWTARHDARQQEAVALKQQVELVMIGDSITHYWETTGAEAWNQRYAPRNALNLGFSGDRTEEMLYRLRSGEVDGLTPDTVVVMAGANNIGHRFDTAEDVALGVGAIIDEVRTRIPDADILLLGLLPRGGRPLLNERTQEVNQLLQQEGAAPDVTYLDMTPAFLDEHGEADRDLMPDGLHPNAAGYLVWADEMAAYL